MNIHRAIVEEGRALWVLFDENEEIVELPTRFAMSMIKKNRYSSRSVEEYLKVIKLLCEEIRSKSFYASSSLDEVLSTVGLSFFEDWFGKMRQQKYSPYTTRTRDVICKSFMQWLTTEAAGRVRSLDDLPYSDGKYITATPYRTVPKYLTYIEAATFIRHAFKNESERCIAHFMFDTGARVSEVPRVCKVDLPNLANYHPDQLYLPILIKGSKGRGGAIKQREAIISRPMVERLSRLHNNWRIYLKAESRFKAIDMPMFLNILGQPITDYAIRNKLYIASKSLLRKGLIQKKVTSHNFRHGTAFSILQSEHGRDFYENLVVCKGALGHSNIAVTEQSYAQIPAPVIAKIQQFNAENGLQERYKEAQYIYENTFKPQRDHHENRGHKRK